jgi:hypothetical protein
MRIEQVLGHYSGQQQKQHGEAGVKARMLQRARAARGTVLDVVCLSDEPGDPDKDFTWFSAYVNQLPDDAVAEKIRQIFRAAPGDDFLVEKLLFEAL